MPLTFQHQLLPNGLDIIAEINPDSHSTAIGMFVNTVVFRVRLDGGAAD